MSDDCEDIAKKCKDFLEEHGARMRQALKALGDEEEDEKQEEDQEMIDTTK